MEKNEVIINAISNAINRAINLSCTKRNYKINIRNYLKAIFKNDNNYDVNEIIKMAYEKAEKVFDE